MVIIKNFKLFQSKKLSTKIALLLIGILLGLNVLSTLSILLVVNFNMDSKENAFMEQTLVNANNQVEDFIEKYVTLTDMLVNDNTVISLVSYGNENPSISDSDNFAEGLAIMEKAVKRYSDILGISFGSIKENFSYTSQGEKSKKPMNERPYYPAVTEDRAYVTQPYIDQFTNKLCISIGMPIKQKDKTVGVICVDLDLSFVSKALAELNFGREGKVILLGEDNTVIGYENAELVGTKFTDVVTGKSFLKELNNPTGKITKYKLNGLSKRAMIMSMPEYDWKLVVGMSAREYNEKTVQTAIILIAILLLTTVIVAIVLWKTIDKRLRPMTQLNFAANALLQGNFDSQITYESDDEIGQACKDMSIAFESLQRIIKEISAWMVALENRDLTMLPTMEFHGEFETIEKSYTQSIRTLNEGFNEIKASAEQINIGADHVSDGAQTLSQGATEQAASIQELTATISDIAEKIKFNAGNALTANELNSKVSSEIYESSRLMNDLMEAMRRITTASNEINNIIKAIEDIAFQTNILALNAAVEAARAGEAGRGFAVVADEVRNLAAKSAEAAQSTTVLIENAIAAVEDGTKIAEDTEKALEHLVEDSKIVTDKIQEIAVSSEEQSNSVEQINIGAEQIASVVQTNSATSEESAAASEELAGQASILDSLINQYKLMNE